MHSVVTPSRQAATSVGIDLGGTFFKVAWFDDAGAAQAEQTRPSLAYRDFSAVLDDVAAVVRPMIADAERRGTRIAAVGVGIPAVIDQPNQSLVLLPNFSASFQGLPLAKELSARIERPVRLINDARAFTLAEWRAGAGRGADDLLAVTLGTGVGGGLILNGRLRLGPRFTAGEFGHIVVAPHGALCGCGSHGCIETVASAPAIVAAATRSLLQGRAPILRDTVNGAVEKVTAAEVTEAARRGDRDCLDIMRIVGDALGLAVANAVKLVDVERVVIGGGVAAAGATLLDPVRESLERNAQVIADRLPEIRIATTQLAGALGAAIWAAEYQSIGELK